MQKKILLLAISLLAIGFFLFQNMSLVNNSNITPAGFEGKLFVGYQAWFNTPNDGTSRGVKHWGNNNLIDRNNITVEMWPDVTEYPSDSLYSYSSSSLLGNGQASKVFTSAHQGVIDKHFQWMRDYEIDGAYLQWFISEPTQYRLSIAQKVRLSADKFGRQFSIMFDISGSINMSGTNNTEKCSDGPSLITCIQNRWIAIVNSGITNSSNYTKYNGLPLISIWGLGFTHNSHLNAKYANDLINWFKYSAPTQYRARVLGGVPTYWRTRTNDSLTEAAWQNTYLSLDIISPWLVGRSPNETEVNNFINSVLSQDVSYLNSYPNTKYLPVIYPGFSWYNLQKGTSPKNLIRRNGGQFLWNMAQNMAKYNIKSLFVAMFDEVDEGTAIFKTSPNNSQSPQDIWTLNLDVDGFSLPSDWYLQVSRLISKALKSTSLNGFDPVNLPHYINPGTNLLPNQSLSNPFVRLTYQSDGNLVVYNQYNQALMASNTTGFNCNASNCIARFQTDGNLVLYFNNTPYWASNTFGNLKIRLNKAYPYLQFVNTNEVNVPYTPTQNIYTANIVQLKFGFNILPNKSVGNSQLRLTFQSDGNLVFYNANNQALWNSRTQGRNCATNCQASFQADGNVVLYQNNVPYWASNTIGQNYSVRLQSTAPVISILNGANQVIVSQ